MGLFSSIHDLMAPGTGEFYSRIKTPSIEEQSLALDQFVLQGIMTPQEAQYFAQNPSAFEQIMTDPALKQVQMDALMGLQDVANQGGMTAQSKARLHDIARDESVRERGSREALMQNQAAKGMGGSGFDLMAQLMNQQGSASRAADRGTQVAADAELRALEALMGAGRMGGQMREQDFGEQARVAQARDAINQFNTMNKMNTNRFNVANANQAQQYNLANQQSLADRNTTLRNLEQQHNKGLFQQQFNNQLGLANAKAGARTTDYNRTHRGLEGMEGSLSNLIGGFGDITKKKQIQDLPILQG